MLAVIAFLTIQSRAKDGSFDVISSIDMTLPVIEIPIQLNIDGELHETKVRNVFEIYFLFQIPSYVLSLFFLIIIIFFNIYVYQLCSI